MKENKVRITLDLSRAFYKRLEQLEDTVDAESKASLIRQALQLYEYITRKTIEGASFRVVNPNGETENLVIFGPINTAERIETGVHSPADRH